MDYLRQLVDNAHALVRSGYYPVEGLSVPAPSLRRAIEAMRGRAIIPEIKFASFTMNTGRNPAEFPRLLEGFVRAGPAALSVLAEPRIFGGDIRFVRDAASSGLPVLMKDIVVDAAQVEAARVTGASAILLIRKLFREGLADGLENLVTYAHEADRDVVLEVNSVQEWDAAVDTEADVIGVNNRDLATMSVDLATTERLLAAREKDRPVIAMSGIGTRADVKRMFRAGADAVLVGSSLMRARDPTAKLRGLIHGD